MFTRSLAFCALLVVAGGAPASTPLRSGPPVGSPNNRSGFLPTWVTGPCAAQRLCPV
jgi:hypothetical protein